jgi:hypothetical protein
MLATSAKRVAWFLALRQSFQFPAYPLAPLPGRRQARRVSAPESGPVFDRAGLTSGSYPPFLPSRQRHLIEASSETRARDSFSNEGTKVATRQRPISQMRWLAKVSAPQKQMVLRHVTSHAGASMVPNTPAASAGADTFDTRKIVTVMSSDWHRRFREGTGIASLSPRPFTSNGGSLEPGPWRPPTTGDKFDPLPREMIDGPTGNPIAPEQFFQARGGLASRGSNLTASEDASRSSSVRGSTLHLDGSALGRWAVEHLHRTLSKPSTGMTGVDPRTTIPRSRVSPF